MITKITFGTSKNNSILLRSEDGVVEVLVLFLSIDKARVLVNTHFYSEATHRLKECRDILVRDASEYDLEELASIMPSLRNEFFVIPNELNK